MNQSIPTKHFKQIVAIVILLIVILFAWLIYYSSTFHIVSTDPNTNGVATVSPFLKINFSKKLSSNNLSISSNPGIIKSVGVNNKTVTLDFNVPLNETKYTITIASVSDASGKILKNLSVSFTPKYIAYGNLPSDQQQTILKQQSAAANNQPPNFSGTGALISNGLSTNQVEDYEQAITSFAQSQNLKLSSVTINESSVVTGPLNPDGIFTINFTVSINKTSYSAKFQYSGLTAGELFLYNGQGSQIFDSGNIDSGGSNSSN